MTESRTFVSQQGQFKGKTVTIKPSSPENIKKEKENREKYLRGQIGKAEFQGRVKRSKIKTASGQEIEVVEATKKASQGDREMLQAEANRQSEEAKAREERQARKQAWIDQYGQAMYEDLRMQQEAYKVEQSQQPQPAPESSGLIVRPPETYNLPRNETPVQETINRTPEKIPSKDLPVLETKYKTPGGKIEADTRDYKKFFIDYREVDKSMQDPGQSVFKSVAVPVGVELASGVFTLADLNIQAVTKPGETIKGFASSVADPIQAGEDLIILARDIPSRPGYVAGNVAFILETGKATELGIRGTVKGYNFYQEVQSNKAFQLESKQIDKGYKFYSENELKLKASEQGARFSKALPGEQTQLYFKNLENPEVVAFEIGERIRQEKTFTDWRNAQLTQEAVDFINKDQVKLTSGKYGDLQNPFKVDYVREGEVLVLESKDPFIGESVIIRDTTPDIQRARIERAVQERQAFIEGQRMRESSRQTTLSESGLQYFDTVWTPTPSEAVSLVEKGSFFAIGKRGSAQIGVSETITEGARASVRYFSEPRAVFKPEGEIFSVETPEIGGKLFIVPGGKEIFKGRSEEGEIYVYRSGSDEKGKDKSVFDIDLKREYDERSRIALIPGLRDIYEPGLKFRESLKIDQAQEQESIIEQRQDQEETRKIYGIFKYPGARSTPEINEPPVLKPLFFSTRKSSSFSGGFNVFGRSGGSFLKLNIEPLTREDALRYGAYRVGNSAMATFKIAETEGKPGLITIGGSSDLSDFYSKDGLFIEKKSRRIKSIGEKQEITFKGIASRRKRR